MKKVFFLNFKNAWSLLWWRYWSLIPYKLFIGIWKNKKLGVRSFKASRIIFLFYSGHHIRRTRTHFIHICVHDKKKGSRNWASSDHEFNALPLRTNVVCKLSEYFWL